MFGSEVDISYDPWHERQQDLHTRHRHFCSYLKGYGVSLGLYRILIVLSRDTINPSLGVSRSNSLHPPSECNLSSSCSTLSNTQRIRITSSFTTQPHSSVFQGSSCSLSSYLCDFFEFHKITEIKILKDEEMEAGSYSVAVVVLGLFIGRSKVDVT